MRAIPVFLSKLAIDLRASYWFVPSGMTILSFGAALGSAWADRNGLTGWMPHLVFATDPAAAQSLIGVIAQAILGAAGVLFSMTMVAVSFASTNFGPRLLGNFMQDRGVQASLGVLLSTFVFCLTILRGMRQGGDLPALSLTLAVALAFLSVAVMIYFVHHIPEIISLENLAARLGRKLLSEIGRLPEAGATETPGGDVLAEVSLVEAGYLQSVDARRIARRAKRRHWQVEMLRGPGEFIAPHVPVIRLFETEKGREITRKAEEAVAALAAKAAEKAKKAAEKAAKKGKPAPAEAEAEPIDDPDALRVNDEDLAALRGAFAVGNGRNEAQNPAFVAQQLAEIIAKALSPGINDPYTARTCLDWLHGALHALAEKGPVDTLEDGGALERWLSFGLVLKLAHTDCRPYIAADQMVTEHALNLLSTLRDTLPAGPRRTLVEQQIADLMDEARGTCPASVELPRLAAGLADSAPPRFTRQPRGPVAASGWDEPEEEAEDVAEGDVPAAFTRQRRAVPPPEGDAA